MEGEPIVEEEAERVCSSCSVEKVIRIGKVDGGKAFVEYEARVVKGGNGGGIFSLWFRYSALREVDNRMRKRYKKQLPDFPGRGIFRNETDPEFIEERRRELNTYLSIVAPKFLGVDADLDAYFAPMVPKMDFALPNIVPIPPNLTCNGEEVWIGVLVDGMYDALRLLVGLKKKLYEMPGVEEQLGLLDLNSAKVTASVESLQGNLPTVLEVIHAPETPRHLVDYFSELKIVSENAIEWSRTIEGAILQHVSDLPEDVIAAAAAAAVVAGDATSSNSNANSLNNSGASYQNDNLSSSGSALPLNVSNSNIRPPPDYTLPTIAAIDQRDEVPVFLPSNHQAVEPIPVYTLPVTPGEPTSAVAPLQPAEAAQVLVSPAPPAAAAPPPGAVFMPAPADPSAAMIAAMGDRDTLASVADEAENLLLRMLAAGSARAEMRGSLVKEQKKLMDRAARAREKATEPLEIQRWTELMQHIEHHVVFSPSLHDAVLRLEQQFFELVDRRGQLKGRSESMHQASDLRRDVIGLRKVLRQIKEESLKPVAAVLDGGLDDPALAADLNRVTDLQENASQLQLEIEQNFDIDKSMEDIVNEKRRENVIKQAEKEHETAENDIFDL